MAGGKDGKGRPAGWRNPFSTLEWRRGTGGYVAMIDQTLLPATQKVIRVDTLEKMRESIRALRVRGAPAIGVAAAYGMVLGLRPHAGKGARGFLAAMERVADRLAGARPTAVNLFWAVDRMKGKGKDLLAKGLQPRDVLARLLEEARAIHAEDSSQCAAIGKHGARLLRSGSCVLTHCNAGALATGGMGTALAVIYAAAAAGKKVSVFADETRPLLQGARLTSWELQKSGIDVTVICDNAAASVFGEGKIDCVVVGADRIARNGDTANKIGTYGVAQLARVHRVPFYVAAPGSTFDPLARGGADIPIENRSPDEVRQGLGKMTTPRGMKVHNPAFDVTPARLVTAFITDKGIIRPPFRKNIQLVLGW
jgi:methylthioribose-1-phosphate isomerase